MKHTLLSLFLLIFIIACDGPEGPEGPAGATGGNGNNGANGLVALTDEAAGDNCSTGGVKITSGTDANGNGTLDAGEVTQTKYVCNGAGGSGPKELRFTLGVFSAGNDPVYNQLYEGFDIKNFEAYDSIVLVVKDVQVKPSGGGDPVDGENAIFEIVDMSNDNAVVTGSLMTVQTGDMFISPNFAAALPEGNFNLGFSVKTENEDFSVLYKPTLVLIDRD